MKYELFSKNIVDNKINKYFQDVIESPSPKVVFSLGGDGTILKAVRKYESELDEVLFAGINTGRLGFYADYKVSDLPELINKIQSNNFKIEKYSLLNCEIFAQDTILTQLCLNEIAITNPIHTQIIEVYINDEYFETFRGTGFLLSTPSGSTAYNKSLGGAIFDNNIEAFQLTEIAPINNRIYQTLNSPILFHSDTVITLKMSSNNNVFVSCDGMKVELENISKIKVKLSNKKVQFISSGKNYYSRIKQAFLDINLFK